MSARAFFDTNILVYTLGQRDDRTPTADALLLGGGVVSVQVLNELASVASRKLRMSWPDVTAALADIKILCPSPIPITVETHDAALRLAVRHGYHIYDALIVAAALEGECSILYSEDLHAGQVIEGRLTIRNPFTEVTRRISGCRDAMRSPCASPAGEPVTVARRSCFLARPGTWQHLRFQ